MHTTCPNNEFVESVIKDLDQRFEIAGNRFVYAYAEFTTTMMKHHMQLEEGYEEKLREFGIGYHATRTMRDIRPKEKLILEPLANELKSAMNELTTLGRIYPDDLENPLERFNRSALLRIVENVRRCQPTNPPNSASHVNAVWKGIGEISGFIKR